MFDPESEAIILNVTKYTCRLCLLQSKKLKSLFDLLRVDEKPTDTISTLAEELASITDIPVFQSDGQPEYICEECIKLMHYAYTFKQRFITSYEILKALANNRVKKEEIDEVYTEEIIIRVDDNHTNENEEDNAEKRIQEHKNKSPKETVVKIGDTSEDEPLDDDFGEVPEFPIKTECKLAPSVKCFKLVKKPKQGQSRIKTSNKIDGNRNNEEKIKTKTRMHQCPICFKQFSALDLHSHIQTHPSLKSYLNIPASKRITRKTRFIADTQTSFANISGLFSLPEKIFTCNICNAKLLSADFAEHRATHNFQNDFKCNKCDRVFLKENYLKTHLVKHRMEYPFNCETCGKGFVIENNYECHKLTHGDVEDLPYACDYCPKRFANTIHAQRHLYTHIAKGYTKQFTQSHRCGRCFARFLDMVDFQRHKETCNGKLALNRLRQPNMKRKTTTTSDKGERKPRSNLPKKRMYPCATCGKVYKSYMGRQLHVEKLHEHKRHLCPVCGISVICLKRHMLGHSNETPFACDVCQKAFKTKHSLKKHMFIHTGLKPFVCRYCGKAFNTSHNLTMHERIHLGLKEHLCTICGKAFLERAYLKKHMLVHEKIV